MDDTVAPREQAIFDLISNRYLTKSGGETLLVVEDDLVLQEVFRRILQRQAYTVLLAGDGDEALRWCQGHDKIDAVLTDVVIPGGSGPELIRRVMEMRPGMKVIYMSGYTEEALAERGALPPGVAFLRKPFTSASLAKTIREALDR